MNNRLVALLLLVPLGGGAAYAQTAPASAGTEAASAPASAAGGWRAALSLANVFEGNVNHDLRPVRSYGVVPAAGVSYERSKDAAFAFGYEIAANSYTGTDEWDRVSHRIYTAVRHQIGQRLRLETEGEASWRGSSDDRELANVFGVSQRMAYRVSKSTRVVLTGVYRYKQYVENPATSGPSPSAGAKVERRLRGGQRLTFGYKYQSRLSRATRNRYDRSAYAIALSTPLTTSGDRLSIDFEYRPQRYQRLIKVAGQQVRRADRRVIAEVQYQRPIRERVDVRWACGVESRRSNDPTKPFLAPSFGMTMSYRLR